MWSINIPSLVHNLGYFEWAVACGMQVMTEAGPWHSRRLHLGQQHMLALKQDFMSAYANTSIGPVEHRPCARLIVIQKNAAAL